MVSLWDGDGHLYLTKQSMYLTTYRAKWLEYKYFSTEALDFFKTSYQKTQPKLLECRINTLNQKCIRLNVNSLSSTVWGILGGFCDPPNRSEKALKC